MARISRNNTNALPQPLLSRWGRVVLFALLITFGVMVLAPLGPAVGQTPRMTFTSFTNQSPYIATQLSYDGYYYHEAEIVTGTFCPSHVGYTWNMSCL